MSNPQAKPEPTGRQFVHAVVWTAAAKWSIQVISWASLILVMRVLSPEDLGITGLAAVYVGFLVLVTEFGIGMAVLSAQDLAPEELSQLHTLAVLIGAAGSLCSVIAAPFLADYFRNPALRDVVSVLGIICLILSARSIPTACLQKRLQFRAIALSEAAQSLVQALLSVSLAYAGFNYWAIVIGNIAGIAIGTIPLVWLQPLRFARPRYTQLRDTLRLSTDIICSRIAWYLYSNADFVVAGRMLGSSAVGIYTFAWNFANLPGEKITTLILRVTPAFFAAVQSDRVRLRGYFLWMTELLTVVMFPIVAGLAIVADDFVAFVFGDKWIAAVPVLQLLAFYAFFRSIVTLLPQVLNVVGQSRFGMWVSFWTLVVMVPAFYFGSRWGVVGIASGWLLGYPATTLPMFRRVLKALDLPWGSYLGSLRVAFVSTIVMLVLVFLVKRQMAEFSTWARLIAEVAVGVFTYVATVRFGHPERWNKYWEMIRNLRSKQARLPEAGY
jgi:teichuronic acid exporter